MSTKSEFDVKVKGPTNVTIVHMRCDENPKEVENSNSNLRCFVILNSIH